MTTKTDEKALQRTPKPGDLRVGTKLRSVSYHGKTFEAEIVADDDGRHLVKVGGKTYRSLSSAGSACMGGIACRGGTFWKVFDRPEYRQAGAAQPEKPKAPKAKSRKKATTKKGGGTNGSVRTRKGIQCGVCKEWFANSAEASKHLAEAHPK